MTNQPGGLKGFDLFRDQTVGIIAAITDPETKRGLLELYAKEVVKQSQDVVRHDTKNRQKVLENGIVYKISTDNNQVLIGWTRDASFGPLIELGYHHTVSRKFIKIPHLRPGANAAKRELRVTARQYLQKKIEGYTP